MNEYQVEVIVRGVEVDEDSLLEIGERLARVPQLIGPACGTDTAANELAMTTFLEAADEEEAKAAATMAFIRAAGLPTDAADRGTHPGVEAVVLRDRDHDLLPGDLAARRAERAS